MRSNMKDVIQSAFDTLAGHAALRAAGVYLCVTPFVTDIRVAIVNLMERAPQGSCLTVDVPELVFTKQQAAEFVHEVARARLCAGVPGGVPALTVGVKSAYYRMPLLSGAAAALVSAGASSFNSSLVATGTWMWVA
jgi:hypothetical protein